ncbi:DnaD domain-containing protein [Tepidiforma thermophila]|uniref:DNA replication protein DnaD n=1 Tax=Tepidiforma thermophila (strain KCTC 52669 / CGMCC 1.13589 / G233) TaxID=2761530 RepID=A0A2A9HCT9_TEPT2|nr:DnaD domain protein [Tepidiforma thermophila]PFG72826.1 DNA replication protein DnaD [Tepidiforma thermophila]
MTTSSNHDAFAGFPGIGKATAIPNLFFATVLPRMDAPGDLLAFLWVARLTQELKAEPRCVSADAIWAHEPARRSFERLAGGRPGLDAGLQRCLELRALLALEVRGPGGPEALYFVNTPAARRSIARALAGELELRPGAAVAPLRAREERPGIFRLYEEHIGTITPLVAEKLVEAEAAYPPDWIEDAFREAAERNIRNWRYIQRMLETWALEGRPDETTGRDALEDAKRRFLGGPFGNIARYR